MDTIEDGLNASREEYYEVIDYLRSKDLLEFYPGRFVSITFKGADVAENFMESSYAGKEYKILQKLYEMVRSITRIG